MNRSLIVALVILTSLASTGAAFAQEKAQIDRGMKVYTDQKCSVCHSIAGKDNAKVVRSTMSAAG